MSFGGDVSDLGLAQGRVLRWKNPKLRRYASGDIGGYVEQGDQENLVVSDS